VNLNPQPLDCIHVLVKYEFFNFQKRSSEINVFMCIYTQSLKIHSFIHPLAYATQGFSKNKSTLLHRFHGHIQAQSIILTQQPAVE
jgi:hypothetical protein